MDICLENAEICDDNNFDEEATYLRKEQIMTETVLNLIEKQGKIIDEMVYYLSDFDIDEMCEKCECCIGNGCHADDDVEFKMRCIKEYFKKKVEDN